MKQFFLILMLAVSVVIAGCRQTSVAGVTSSDEEAAWEATIRSNYSGYRPPRNSAPAEFDNTSSRRSAAIKKSRAGQPAVAPAADPVAEEIDPVAVVDNAAEMKPAADPAAKSAEAPKAEVKAEVPKAEVKAEAPKAEEKAEAQKDAKKTQMEPSEPTASTVYVVKSGDTLGGIAQHFYGSARYYEIISRANVDVLKNSNALKPGMKLIIPKL